MLEIVFLVILGIFAGVFTGLTPGIHPNTVIFAFLPFYFALNFDFVIYASFISGMSLSHTFHDFIPSIFLGVPEPDSALTALPGQDMALEGRGVEAFVYTVYGGLYSMLAGVVLAYPLYILIEEAYRAFEPVMPYCLLFVLLFIVFKSENWLNSGTVTALSGALGVLSFSVPVNQQYVLTPIFGGMFALPSVFNALREGEKLPEQSFSTVPDLDHWKGGFLGFVSSIPITLFPGLTNTVSTTFLMPLIENRKSFISAMGAVNTSDIFLSFLTLIAMEKARSGASVAIQVTGNTDLVVFVLGCSLLSAALSAPLSFHTVRLFLGSVLIENQAKLSVAVIAVLICTIVYLTGFLGLLIFAVGSAIGFFASINNERHSCMAVLLVPAILFFTGSGIFM